MVARTWQLQRKRATMKIRAFSRVLAIVAVRRNERLSTAKPAGRNRYDFESTEIRPRRELA